MLQCTLARTCLSESLLSVVLVCGIAGLYNNCVYFFEKSSNCFLQQLHLPAMCEVPVSIFLLGTSYFLLFKKIVNCWVSHYGFGLYFPNEQWWWAPFMCYWAFVFLLWRCVYLSPLLSFELGCLYVELLRVLYVVWILNLYQMYLWFTDYFLIFCESSFHSLLRLCAQKFLVFMKSLFCIVILLMLF